MRYEIPNYRLEKLQKMIKRAQNKGGNISLTVIREFDKEYEVVVNDDASRTSSTVKVLAPTSEVEIKGEYKINGWKFISTIEHTPNGNIIRCIEPSLESSIPKKYLTCGPECEHCHKIRDRKDTFLIYNEETKEFKQVGKTCLLDYTQGLTPATCEAFSNVFNYCASCEEFEDDEFMKDFRSYSSDMGFDNDEVKKLAYGIVKKFGYEKSDSSKYSTASKITNCLFSSKEVKDLGITLGTDDEIKAIDDYANSITDEYGYMRNAKLAWLNSKATYRDFALIGSFVSTYFKNVEKVAREKHNKETTNFVGNIGDKITFDVDTCKVAYTKSFGYGYSRYSDTSVWIIVDTNGNTYKWSTNLIKEGTRENSLFTETFKPVSITATVQDHQEYRGVKQTVITRGKVVYDITITYKDGTTDKFSSLKDYESHSEGIWEKADKIADEVRQKQRAEKDADETDALDLFYNSLN